jgi:hypothetical protein
LAVCGSTPSSPFAEPEPSVREEPDLVATHTAAFICFAAPGRHRVEPLFSDTFTIGPPLDVGELRISPISCGAWPLRRGCVSSLARSSLCPCTPPRRRAYTDDAVHRARPRKSFLAGAAAFVDARAARCSAPCLPVRRHERWHAGHARTPTCVNTEQSRSYWSHVRPGSTRTHSPFTARTRGRARSRVARPSFWSPKIEALR